jgi:hypothetical protein
MTQRMFHKLRYLHAATPDGKYIPAEPHIAMHSEGIMAKDLFGIIPANMPETNFTTPYLILAKRAKSAPNLNDYVLFPLLSAGFYVHLYNSSCVMHTKDRITSQKLEFFKPEYEPFLEIRTSTIPSKRIRQFDLRHLDDLAECYLPRLENSNTSSLGLLD